MSEEEESRSADYSVIVPRIQKAAIAAKVLIDKFKVARAAAEEAENEAILTTQFARNSQEMANEAMISASRITLEAAEAVDCAYKGVLAADEAIDESNLCDDLAEKALFDALAAFDDAQGEGVDEKKAKFVVARAKIEDAKGKQRISEGLESEAFKAIKRGRVMEHAGRSSSLTTLRDLNYAAVGQHNADMLRVKQTEAVDKAIVAEIACGEAKRAVMGALVELTKVLASTYSRSVGEPAAKKQKT